MPCPATACYVGGGFNTPSRIGLEDFVIRKNSTAPLPAQRACDAALRARRQKPTPLAPVKPGKSDQRRWSISSILIKSLFAGMVFRPTKKPIIFASPQYSGP